MRISTTLQIWAFCVLLTIAEADNCPGRGGCQVRQLASPQYTTLLLQCNGSNCESAIFAPSPRMVCLVRNSNPSLRIYLRSCVEFNENPQGYLLQGANVVHSTSIQGLQDAVFYDTSCGTICEAIEVVIYTSNNQMLVAESSQVTTSPTMSCSRGFYVYPNVIPYGACSTIGATTPPVPAPMLRRARQAGPFGPSGTPGQVGPSGSTGSTVSAETQRIGTLPKRQCLSQTRQRALLTVTNGTTVFAVGEPEFLNADGMYRLPIVGLSNGEEFYIQQYNSQAVGASQTVELVTAYTIQLARSRRYLVADVLNDTRLNIRPNTTGLNLEDASEYPPGYAKTADYRFFVRYDVNVSGLNVTVFCPLFHRNHCILPAVSGFLRLALLRSNDLSVEPTFFNPTDQELRDYVLNSRPANLVGPWHVAFRVI